MTLFSLPPSRNFTPKRALKTSLDVAHPAGQLESNKAVAVLAADPGNKEKCILPHALSAVLKLRCLSAPREIAPYTAATASAKTITDTKTLTPSHCEGVVFNFATGAVVPEETW